MTKLLETKIFIDDFFERHEALTEGNFQELAGVLNRGRAIELLQEVTERPELCQEVAQRSHRHSQGFGKIVLIDDREKAGYKLRFHTWPKNVKEGASPITEDKHEHRWDFASVVLMGHMENQRYSIRNLNLLEQAAWEKFEKPWQENRLQK